MNPYSVNVELYHKRISPNPDPRDILSPTVSSRPTKAKSLLKLLGTLANGKTRALVVGGIVTAGSIHMVRKGVKWFFRKRCSANVTNEVEDGSHNLERGTQTDAPEKLLTSVQDSTSGNNVTGIGETCNSEEIRLHRTMGMSSCTVPSTKLDQMQVPRINSVEQLDSNPPPLNLEYHKTISSGCQCSEQAKAEREVSQYTQSMHPVCQLSIIMALLALQKVSSCEAQSRLSKAWDVQNACQDEERSHVGKKSLFSPGIKFNETNLKSMSGVKSFKDSGFKIGELSECDSDPPKRNTIPSKPRFSRSQTPTSRSSNPKYHSNPFGKQKTDKPEIQKAPTSEDKVSLKVSDCDSHASKLNSTKELGDRNLSTETLDSNTSAARKQPARKTNVASSSTAPHNQELTSRPRGKPKRRGGRRGKNARRRQQVDLDNPNQVAS